MQEAILKLIPEKILWKMLCSPTELSLNPDSALLKPWGLG